MGAESRKWKGWKANTQVWIRESPWFDSLNKGWKYKQGLIVGDAGSKRDGRNPNGHLLVLSEGKIRWVNHLHLVPSKNFPDDPETAFRAYWGE